METLTALGLGLGLAAACGMRVFVPLLAVAVATRVGLVTPGAGFAWLASWPALVALSTAALVEIGAYYVPWVDNALDSLATPAAVIAGALVTATQLGMVGSGSDLIDHIATMVGGGLAGGGIAGLVQVSTVGARGLSTISTAGLGNAVVATLENVGAVVLSILAILIPALIGLVIAVVGVLLVRRWVRRRARGPHRARPQVRRAAVPVG